MVSVAPELMVIELHVAGALITGCLETEGMVTSVEAVGTALHDQLAATFQSVSTDGVRVIPPTHVPGIQEISTYNIPVVPDVKSPNLLTALDEIPPYVVLVS